MPYSHTEFTVPSNVYIIGTMNTADRSIALLDTALRRRFEFVEMMPEPSNLKSFEENYNNKKIKINLPEMLKAMNDRIECLYDREHTIGHAYFMKDGKSISSLDELKSVFKNKIIPLLQEYFFNDYEKIKLVLNDSEGNFLSSNKENKYLSNLSEYNIDMYEIKQDFKPDDFANIYFEKASVDTESNNEQN